MTAVFTLFAILSVSFSHLSYLDGLSTGSVTDICFDEKGVIWIGTGNGLNSYDGNRVYNHPVRNNSIMRLACDGKGTLYVASLGELFSLDLASLEYRHISDDDSRAIAWHGGCFYAGTGNVLKRYRMADDGELSCETIYTLGKTEKISALVLENDGIVWMGTETGDLVSPEAENRRERRYHLGSMVENLHIDSRGILWAATFADGLASLDRKGRLSFMHHDENQPESISSNFVRSVCEDDDGNLWVGTFAGLDCLDRESGTFSHNLHDKTRPESLSNSSVWVVRKDAQGSIWAGTFFGGVNWFNPAFEVWTRFQDSGENGSGLSSPLISSVDVDADGNLLVATEGGGFNMINPLSFKSITYNRSSRSRISADNVKDIVYDGDCVWLGTHLGGLERIELQKGQLKDGEVRRGKAVHFVPKGAGEKDRLDDILCLEDADDSLYVGSIAALFILDKKSGKGRKICSSKNVNTRLTGIRALELDSRERLWFLANGLSVYDPESCDTLSFPQWKDVQALCIGNGGYPIVCNGKQLSFLDKNDRQSSCLDLGESLGEGESVSGIVQSPHSGRIILSTNKGFIILEKDGTQYGHFLSGQGFPIYCPNSKALAVTRDGTVYIGGLSGLVSFNEDRLDFGKVPFRICFSKLYLDGSYAGTLTYSKSVDIAPGTSSFSIEFLSTNHIAANSCTFEYMLEGLGKSWTKILGGNRISFSGIPYGKYSLRVRPCGCAGDICGEISLPIEVIPPWYLSLTAKILYLVGLCAAIALGLRRLVILLRKREAEKLALLSRADSEKYRIFERATSVVYGNLDNSSFSINEFAAEMMLSRSSLFEKLKAATGQTPNDFLLTTRLKESARLLKNNPELNVSDVAFRVGFTSPHYFSRCFKARYGESPILWRQKNREDTFNGSSE